MSHATRRTICWKAVWNTARNGMGLGLEHLLLTERTADSVILACDEQGKPFRLVYRLAWDESWRLRQAELSASTEQATHSLTLLIDEQGWRHSDGRTIEALDGCLDIDIWPTPFTNSLPIRRALTAAAIGERRQFNVAWIHAPDLAIHAQAQAYTRLADRLYLFESLDGSGFKAELTVDEAGIVLDYPGLFQRLTTV